MLKAAGAFFPWEIATEKNAIPVQKYVGIAETIYVVAVAHLFYEAKPKAGGVLLIDGNPFAEAAFWPLYLRKLLF